jgi:hypothetical protein
VVAVRVNGGDLLYFLLDTGAGQTVLDKTAAAKLKLTTFGATLEPGAGESIAREKQGTVVYARISALALGVWVLHDLPVILKNVNASVGGVAGNTSAGSGAGTGSYPISGVIGTELLYHFLATIDFNGAELILRRKIALVAGPLRTELAGERAAVIPFRLVGDHYMLADGTVNGVGPLPFFVDTGLAGYAFTAPVSTLRAAKLLPEMSEAALAACDPDSKAEGSKSSGKADADVGKVAAPGVTMVPFAIETLTLGPVTRRNLTGVAGAFPAGLERATGVRVGGLVSQPFFRPYAVTFDFETGTLWVTGGS